MSDEISNIKDEFKDLHSYANNIVDRAAKQAASLVIDAERQAITETVAKYYRRNNPRFLRLIAILAIITSLIVGIPVAVIVTGIAERARKSETTLLCNKLKASVNVQRTTQQELQAQNKAYMNQVRGKNVFGLTPKQLNAAIQRSKDIQQKQLSQLDAIANTDCN